MSSEASQASPLGKGYLPLLQIHPWGSMIGFLLGWLHDTLDPIWLSPPEAYHYVVVTEEEYGCFTVPDRPGMTVCQEHQLRRIVTKKGSPADAYMIANDFVYEAFMQAVDNPFPKTVTVPALGGGRDLQIWRLRHNLPASSQEMYVAFEFEVLNDPEVGSLVRAIIEQRDDAYDRVLRDQAGKMQSLVKAARGQWENR